MMNSEKDAVVASNREGSMSNVSKDDVAIASSTLITDDAAIRDFYGDAVPAAYRMKSELVAQHLADIGMGKYV